MHIIKLISWHEDILVKAASLKRRGLIIDATPLKASSPVSELAALNPAVLILDLDKLPSRSREIATSLRSSKSARHIPILFAGGLPEKIERIQADFPGDTFTTWPDAPKAINSLLDHPPATPPIKPHRDFSSTPLPKKLGIAAKMHVALIAAPDAFEKTLGDLPPHTTLIPHLTPSTQLALCFIRSLNDLTATVDLLSLRLPQQAHAWIVYPKRTSQHRVDLNENDVRDHALAVNLVDYKVCSIDSEWSALKFARRKPQR